MIPTFIEIKIDKKISIWGVIQQNRLQVSDKKRKMSHGGSVGVDIGSLDIISHFLQHRFDNHLPQHFSPKFLTHFLLLGNNADDFFLQFSEE